MDIQAQRIYAWGALFSLLMAIGGPYIAGFLPPPSPAETAEQVAALYRANAGPISICAILFLFSTAPALLFIDVLSVQIRRIEGTRRTYTDIQMVAGTASLVPIVLAPLAWSVAVFSARAKRSEYSDLTMVMTTPMVAV
jgi:cytochrome bd-type quinol oxidase subunit 2